MTPDGIVSFDFSGDLDLNSDISASGRRLSELIVVKQDGVENNLEAINIHLINSNDPTVTPIEVEWQLLDFNGKNGHLQMNVDKLYDSGIDMTDYDQISITIDELEKDEQHVAHETIRQMALPPLDTKNNITFADEIAQACIALVCVALTASVVLAVF